MPDHSFDIMWSTGQQWRKSIDTPSAPDVDQTGLVTVLRRSPNRSSGRHDPVWRPHLRRDSGTGDRSPVTVVRTYRKRSGCEACDQSPARHERSPVNRHRSFPGSGRLKFLMLLAGWVSVISRRMDRAQLSAEAVLCVLAAAADLRHRRAFLTLLDDEGLLRVRELRCLHTVTPRPAKDVYGGKL